MYVPGNLLFRRWVDAHSRLLLVTLALACAVVTAALRGRAPERVGELRALRGPRFLAGGRTLAGSARGLNLAPALRLGVTGLRTAALQFGSFVGAAVGGVALAAGRLHGAPGWPSPALFARGRDTAPARIYAACMKSPA